MRENVTIAVVAPVQPEDFFDLLWEGVWEATFDLPSFGVEVRNLATQRHDAGEQRKTLQALLSGPIDGIVILPAHFGALDDLITEHERRGTGVVTFYGDAPGSSRSAFVGPDSFAAGSLAAEVLAKLMNGRGRVLSFPGPQERHHFAKRYQGFRAKLGRRPGLGESAFPRPADAVTPGLLDALSQAQGIYVGNQDLATVAAAPNSTTRSIAPLKCQSGNARRCFVPIRTAWNRQMRICSTFPPRIL